MMGETFVFEAIDLTGHVVVLDPLKYARIKLAANGSFCIGVVTKPAESPEGIEVAGPGSLAPVKLLQAPFEQAFYVGCALASRDGGLVSPATENDKWLVGVSKSPVRPDGTCMMTVKLDVNPNYKERP